MPCHSMNCSSRKYVIQDKAGRYLTGFSAGSHALFTHYSFSSDVSKAMVFNRNEIIVVMEILCKYFKLNKGVTAFYGYLS